MYQIRRMLDDILDYSFRNDFRLMDYKKYQIEVLEEEFASRHGDYRLKERKIRLMNLYRDDVKLTLTAIHEMAHHVNHVQGNKDAHGSGFYANLKILLHGALDLKIIDKEECERSYERRRDAQGSGKERKIILDYEPKETNYKAGMEKIVVYGGYDDKEELKARGFFYNRIIKGWEKEIKSSCREEITPFLDSRGLKYTVTDAAKVLVKDKDKAESPLLLSVRGGYPLKEELKQMNFAYRAADKSWIKGCSTTSELKNVYDLIIDLCKRESVEIKSVKRQSIRETVLTVNAKATFENEFF